MIRKTLALPLLFISIALLVVAPLGVFLPTWANQPGAPAALAFPMHPAVADAWAATDGQIVNAGAERAWLWGPSAIAMTVEYYAGSPTGQRQMIYFEKGRLDVFDPTAAADSPWFAVGGLLVSEMISGQVQFGENVFVLRGPASIPVAGDLDQPNPVTYASFAALRNAQIAQNLRGENALLVQASAPKVPARVGATITSVLQPDGSVDPYGMPAAEVLFAAYNETTGHNVAAPFVAWEAAQPFPPTWLLGNPISEPYWIDTVVLGTPKRVLVQAFERRVLTYTPDNPPAWQVESTNAGTHYRLWRGLSQPADISLTGLASLEPSGEEIVAAATVNGVDPYLLAAIARVASGGNPLATSPTGGYGLLGVQPLQGGAPQDDPFANAAQAARQLAGSAGLDQRAVLADYYQPGNPNLGDPYLAQIVDTTLATAERLRDTYAPQPEEPATPASPLQASGAALRWASDFDIAWWENSLRWYGSWGGAVPGWQLDPAGYYCAHPEYAPGERLRLIANGVTLDCTIATVVADNGLLGWGDSWVVELNDAAFAALRLDENNALLVAENVPYDPSMRKINMTTTPGVLIGSGQAAYYSPDYDRAWWEWAMSYYNSKGVITPGWSLDPNGLYCVHPNYLPGDRLRLVANGTSVDCTIGDMVADQDVYNWRLRFVVELSWDTFAALGLQNNNQVDVYYLGPAPKPERYGEPPTATPEPTPSPTAEPPPTEAPAQEATPEPTTPAEPTADPTEVAEEEPTETATEEPTEEPTAVATESPAETATPEPTPSE